MYVCWPCNLMLLQNNEKFFYNNMKHYAIDSSDHIEIQFYVRLVK